MAICKLCQQEKGKLTKCHIYPDSMTKESAEDGVLAAASNRHGPRVADGIAGIFDRNIVCRDCERLFQRADNYAINFRRAALRLDGILRLAANSSRLPVLRGNADLLHTFAMQSLLRAGLSERPEHDQVEGGPLVDEVYPALVCEESTIRSGRQVALVFHTGALGGYAATPTFHDVPGYPLHVLAMPNMHVLIAASDSGLQHPLNQLALKQGSAEITIWRVRRPLDEIIFRMQEVLEPNDEKLDRLFDALHRSRNRRGT